jgi:gliding motility-associated-like protein
VESDQSVLVQVFTRYGSKIFESKGYSTPWNGEYNHAKLPAGVYYYIVTANNNTQKFSGSLTILY